MTIFLVQVPNIAFFENTRRNIEERLHRRFNKKIIIISESIKRFFYFYVYVFNEIKVGIKWEIFCEVAFTCNINYS